MRDKVTLERQAGHEASGGRAEDHGLEALAAEPLLRDLKLGSDKMIREFRKIIGAEIYGVTPPQPGGYGSLKPRANVITRQQSAHPPHRGVGMRPDRATPGDKVL